MDLSTEAITREKRHRIRDVFRDHDLPVCAVSGYRNLVHPDPAEREANIRHLKALLRHARRSEEHTSELQSLMRISYAVFCLKKKSKKQQTNRKNKSKQDT